MANVQKFILLAATITLLLSAQSRGQTATSSLRGTVSDSQHAIVVGAGVTLSNPSTGFSQSMKTDNYGVYQFLQIPPGTYTLTVSQAGFATIKHDGLQLLVNVPATSDVTLPVKGETAVIEVTGNTV
ncbi:MAG: carboxypeptidase-like regulatory domain-containing protein, partial [Candidatus Sulfotelmatobacter sp.]